jgi:hypothetical protein
MAFVNKTTNNVRYIVNGEVRNVALCVYRPAVPTSQMFSYVTGEDVSCEEKKVTWNTSEDNSMPTWTFVFWRRVVINRKTEYRCMTKAEADELKSLVCSDSINLSLTNEMNGWWRGSTSETIKGDWERVHEVYRE